MKSIKAPFLAAAVALLALASQAAEQRIAVINIRTVFDGYWRTKQSDLAVKDRQAEYTKDRTKMVDDYQKANEEYRKLTESATDQAVSAEEREKRKKSAETKLIEIKDIERSIGTFDQTFRTQITDQIKRMRDSIVREIRELVNTKAKAAGYTLVFDSAAESFNQTPVVLFSSGTPDLTDEILTQLNANAPAGALTAPPEKTDEKAADKKDDKQPEKKDDKK